MPICLVFLTGGNAKKAKCFACQHFGHGSQNCGDSFRCVKFAGEHKLKDCRKTKEELPACCNCDGANTANYRGCPFYQFEITNKTKTSNPEITHPTKTYPPNTTEDIESEKSTTTPKPEKINVMQMFLNTKQTLALHTFLSYSLSS